MPEHGGEPLARSHDALVEEFPVVGDRAQLALALMESNSYSIYATSYQLSNGHPV